MTLVREDRSEYVSTNFISVTRRVIQKLCPSPTTTPSPSPPPPTPPPTPFIPPQGAKEISGL